MVQTSFLLESSFVALTSIAVGPVLGVAVGYNVVADAKRTPSWESMAFHVPWLTLGGDLPARLRRRAGNDARAGPPRIARLPRGGAALRMTSAAIVLPFHG